MNAVTPITAAPPALITAEQGVLGALLVNNGLVALVSSYLRAEHFAELAHQAIYAAIVERVAQGRPATALTLAADLPPFADPDLTAPAYLARLVAEAWTVSSTIEGTAKEVARAGARRALSRLGAGLAVDAATPGMLPEDTVANAELELVRISDDLATLNAGNKRSEDYDAVVAAAEERMTTGRWLRGVPSGLEALDNKLGGFAPGDFIVLGGRPSAGKTALGVALSRSAARVGAGVGFISVEMPEGQVRQRLLTDECYAFDVQVAYQNLARGKIDKRILEAVRAASSRLKKLPLVILDRGNRLSDLPGHIRRVRRELKSYGKDLDLLVIDYLGLLRPGDRYKGQRVNEMAEISGTVKTLAKAEGIAIIGLHQLNRMNTQREDRRPRMDELRDSGALEQDADVVLFVHREAYYIARPGYVKFATAAERHEALIQCQHEMEVIIAKQRQGPVGTIKLFFDETNNAVRNLANA